MPNITSKCYTILKTKPVQSSLLLPEEKQGIEKGVVVEVKDIKKAVENHLAVILKTGGIRYAFAPDWQINGFELQSESGFDGDRFAAFAEKEARKALKWGVNEEAYKYTRAFEKYFGKSRFAWCGAFCHWCVNTYGVDMPTKVNQADAYTFALVEYWKIVGERRGWFTWNDGKQHPKAGDFLIFDWQKVNHRRDKLRDWADHIGVFLSLKTINGQTRYITAEGNARNSSGIFSRIPTTIEGWVRIPQGTEKI